jgi:hypothetical protein
MMFMNYVVCKGPGQACYTSECGKPRDYVTRHPVHHPLETCYDSVFRQTTTEFSPWLTVL